MKYSGSHAHIINDIVEFFKFYIIFFKINAPLPFIYLIKWKTQIYSNLNYNGKYNYNSIKK